MDIFHSFISWHFIDQRIHCEKNVDLMINSIKFTVHNCLSQVKCSWAHSCSTWMNCFHFGHFMSFQFWRDYLMGSFPLNLQNSKEKKYILCQCLCGLSSSSTAHVFIIFLLVKIHYSLVSFCVFDVYKLMQTDENYQWPSFTFERSPSGPAAGWF